MVENSIRGVVPQKEGISTTNDQPVKKDGVFRINDGRLEVKKPTAEQALGILFRAAPFAALAGGALALLK